MDGRALRNDVAVVVADGVVRDIVPSHLVGQGACAGSPVVRVQLLLPGFLNAHCHLEYTGLEGRLPRGDVDFGRWIEAIGALKRAVSPEEQAQAALEGCRRLARGGCTTVFDSVSCPAAAAAARQGPIRYFVFWEVLGLVAETVERTLGAALAYLGAAATSPHDRLFGMGINPHAPYSVGPQLRSRLRRLLQKQPHLPCAWHLGETQAEVDLFMYGKGALADFLTRNSLPKPFETVPGVHPLQFLQQEQLFERCDIAFHLNCFSRESLRHFQPPRAVVHCPGTHLWFKRDPFPYLDLLRAGVNLCLATDSLASSETLDMLQLLRLAARECPCLTAPQLLDMITRNPARTRAASMAPAPLAVVSAGAAADFVTLRGAKGPGAGVRPFRETLLDPATQVDAVFVDGERVSF